MARTFRRPFRGLRARMARPMPRQNPNHLAFRDFKRPNPVIVHDGSNAAENVASLRQTLGACQIHCFEPNQEAHASLTATGATVIDHALGREAEDADNEQQATPVGALDSHHLAPDIIRLDGQSSIDDVLAGARVTIATHHPLFLLETDSARASEAARALHGLGYRPARYDEGANCLVLDQRGDSCTMLIHPHHEGLLSVSVV